MHNWDREQQDNKFRQKLNNVKSTLPKINHPNTTTNSSSKHKTTAASLPFTKNLRKQNNLKYILREFGLSQYIRKLFNLGYDDSNIRIFISGKKSETMYKGHDDAVLDVMYDPHNSSLLSCSSDRSFKIWQ